MSKGIASRREIRLLGLTPFKKAADWGRPESRVFPDWSLVSDDMLEFAYKLLLSHGNLQYEDVKKEQTRRRKLEAFVTEKKLSEVNSFLVSRLFGGGDAVGEGR